MRNDQIRTLLRFLIWGGFLSLLLLRYFDVNPITIEDAPREAIPTEPPQRTTGEVLIVVDTRAIAESARKGSFRQTDWSFAWINTIEQEVGPCSLLEADRLRTTDLTPYRFIVLTQSVASTGTDSDTATMLKSYVHNGGVLILERPGGALREAFAADGRGGQRNPKILSHVKDLPTPYDAYLKSMPLNTSYIGSSGPAPGAVTWLAMDGVPVVYTREMSRGLAVVIEFDLGRQLVSLQQGRPRDDFSVVNRYPDMLMPALESNDLVTDERMLTSEVPYADLLEKYLMLKVIGHARPAIGLWGFKDAHQGALLMTHDEEMMGDKSTWMAKWEKENGWTSTYFVIPNEEFTAKGAKDLRQSGVDVQLHWNRPYKDGGLYDPVGVWKINPFQRARNLHDQYKELSALLPGERPLIANRNHYLLWGETYTGVFRELAAVGISIDTTYGPDKGARGYLFGTGLPFWAIDQNGLPLPVIEHPMLTAETLGGVDAKFMYRLMRDSHDTWHQAINVLYHPNAYQWMPSVELFDLWLATYDLAKDHDHWITTTTTFHRFWKERRTATVNTRMRVGKGLSSPRDGKKDELLAKDKFDPNPITINVEVKIDGKGHHISAPLWIKGRKLREVRDGDGQSTTGRSRGWRHSRVFDLPLALIPVDKGFNTLTLSYR